MSPSRCSRPPLRISALDGRRVGIWGAGREGASAYRALIALTSPSEIVVVTDSAASAEERAPFSDRPAVRYAHGAAGLRALEACDVVIRSPGVSLHRPEVKRLSDAGVQMTSGTNLWMAEHPDARTIAVTGSMGKSTTSALLAHLARAREERVVLAGNIGEPLLDHLAPAVPPDLWVLELSSFQTADLEGSPAIAVVLNLVHDHLDWHGTYERYFADKLRVLHDRDRVHAVLSARDARLREIELPETVSWFGAPGGYDADGQDVTFEGRTVLRGADSPLLGEHNALNICAALTALSALDEPLGGEPPVSDLAGALRDFHALPHRVQPVGCLGAVTYVNDSISTTPESAIAALNALAPRPIVLIAGGFDREQVYDGLAATIVDLDLLAVVALPDTGPRLLDAVRTVAARVKATPPALLQADDIDAAVASAAAAIDGEGIVLLSPAAPSFNAFRDFTERGERFAAAVARLRAARSAGGVG
jgi:UDP-N-acetylmuramoyl-L-alanine---L-glutamate ligase